MRLEGRLKGKTVVLTGAAGGIGSLLCHELRAAGATVVGVDRVDCSEADETIVADLASQEGLKALNSRIAQRHVDILVNLAGMQHFGPFDRQGPEQIWTCYAVNLIAPATLTRCVLPQMQARGAGQIVNIGSVLGAVNYPYFAAYSSSKAGLRGLSDALRRELDKSGIAITYIAPRAVRTAFNDAEVNRFLDIAKMRPDEPAVVAHRIARAIIERRKEVTLGIAERFYTRLNGAFPRLVDAGLKGTVAKAQALFPN
ncbi:SDR family NAD(P)-dependent oxidoreductase [Sphingomonas alba]|uniref:SDR family NAD(P)-dependent oxidoreductase n=1 Tax=Sphingomonas alba TaxID=2908208 RepID=A0ABT0RPU7_9SPHN|nr:SDR family NAD(P)-dependent oxidoreductase [Sphingomonas alba]MCL6684487.1 SDR family NAD(P)-dependent oxidoreductase [Sphingomonas alba]